MQASLGLPGLRAFEAAVEFVERCVMTASVLVQLLLFAPKATHDLFPDQPHSRSTCPPMATPESPSAFCPLPFAFCLLPFAEYCDFEDYSPDD